MVLFQFVKSLETLRSHYIIDFQAQIIKIIGLFHVKHHLISTYTYLKKQVKFLK